MSNLIDRLAAYFDRKGDTFGQWYTRCLVGFLIAWCVAGFLVGLALGFGVNQVHYAAGHPSASREIESERDDFDDPTGKRSGMIVYTDHRTGCQYLGTILGGITARLDRDGKPVCTKQEPMP